MNSDFFVLSELKQKLHRRTAYVEQQRDRLIRNSATTRLGRQLLLVRLHLRGNPAPALHLTAARRRSYGRLCEPETGLLAEQRSDDVIEPLHLCVHESVKRGRPAHKGALLRPEARDELTFRRPPHEALLRRRRCRRLRRRRRWR